MAFGSSDTIGHGDLVGEKNVEPAQCIRIMEDRS